MGRIFLLKIFIFRRFNFPFPFRPFDPFEILIIPWFYSLNYFDIHAYQLDLFHFFSTKFSRRLNIVKREKIRRSSTRSRWKLGVAVIGGDTSCLFIAKHRKPRNIGRTLHAAGVGVSCVQCGDPSPLCPASYIYIYTCMRSFPSPPSSPSGNHLFQGCSVLKITTIDSFDSMKNKQIR